MKKNEMLMLKNMQLEQKVHALNTKLNEHNKHQLEIEIQLDGLERVNKEFAEINSTIKELKRMRRKARINLKKEIFIWKIKQLFKFKEVLHVRKNL